MDGNDGMHFRYDGPYGAQPIGQRDRDSPPALDEVQMETLSPKRPPNLMIPHQGTIEHKRFEKILKRTDDHETISGMEYLLREEVQDILNKEKEDRSDWRAVASKMAVKAVTIDKIKTNHKDNPTNKLFDEISHRKTKELLQVLYQMNRQDVLNVFFEKMSIMSDESKQAGTDEKRKLYHSTKFSSQETTPVSGTSSASEFSPTFPTPDTPNTPSKDCRTPDSARSSDSGMASVRSRASGKTPRSARRHSDERNEHKSTVNFHSEESKNFWRAISLEPEATTKPWKEFEKTFEKYFPKESSNSLLMRFICYVLTMGPYEERYTKDVHDQDFANLVAWFGPMNTSKNGCLNKMETLIKGSVEKKGGIGPQSFFAGYMSKDEADRIIAEQPDLGTFLIRFSSSEARTGSFVVVLKTHDGPEHILIKGDPDTGKLKFHGEEYEDLVTLWKKGLRTGGVSSDGRISCRSTCPNLPLNVMFKPYHAGPTP